MMSSQSLSISDRIVLVTGGSGLVGSAIQEYVQKSGLDQQEKWIFLSSHDGDLRNREATDAIFQRFQPTHVIHLAAKVGGLFANMAKKVKSFLWSHKKNKTNILQYFKNLNNLFNYYYT